MEISYNWNIWCWTGEHKIKNQEKVCREPSENSRRSNSEITEIYLFNVSHGRCQEQLVLGNKMP